MGIFDSLTADFDAAAANRQQLRDMAAGGLVPASAAPGPSFFQRLFGVGVDGSPYQAPFGSQSPDASSSPTGGGIFSRLLGGGQPAPVLPSATQSTTAPGAAPSPVADTSSAPAGGLTQLIGTTAQKYGIDPMTAVRVAMSEGGRSGGYGPNGIGDGGTSFSPFQLHYGGGMGDDFTKATGLDAADPKNMAAAVDYALMRASKEGWGAFHGAARAGVGAFQGIGGAKGGAQGGAVIPAAYAPPPAGGAPGGANASDLGAAAQNAAAPQSRLNGMASLPQIQALIAGPSTRQLGLRLWEQYLSPPKIEGVKSGEAIFSNGHYIGQAPTTPMDLGPGHSAVDTNPGGRGVIAAVPAEKQPTEIGVGPWGEKLFGSFDKQTGAVAPFPGAPGVVPNGDGGQPPVDPNLHGEDYLKTQSPQFAGMVKAIAEGRMALPAGQSANNPQAMRIKSAVLQYKPDFDVTDTAARAETRKDFASGNTAGVITAGNTALQHLGHLSDAGEMLTASQIPAFNSLGQKVETAGGGNVAGKQYEGALNDFVGELTKFYRGTGGTEADIASARALLAPNQSPAQRRASIAQQAALVQSKVNALQARWKQGMGANTPDYPLLQPEAMDALNRIVARGPTAGGSGAPTGAPTGATGPLPTAAPAGASPAGAASSPLDQARAAIARGAPRDTVIQRLQGMGVDTKGL